MATSMGRSPGIRWGARPAAERFTTETKAAPRTTEFFSFIAVVAGILVSAAIVDGGGGADPFAAKQAWLYVAIVAAAYMISRGLAKSGSYEPYFAEGDSERGPGETAREERR
ncbi:MAG: hypothetical protein JWN65_581 [Solirubrobacterales bacterium]|nr:hypothetical protein [Solirubrobacterales bacterium]